VALGYRYTEGAIVGGDPYAPTIPDDFAATGEPGTRAPHLWLNRDGAKLSTLDLFERVPVLLTAENSAWHAAAAPTTTATWVPLECRPFTADDADTDWQKAYGIGPDGAVLVRPDGFVAWRSPGSARDPEAELRSVLREVLSLSEDRKS
jgi:putative polyketide hydroxylase